MWKQALRGLLVAAVATTGSIHPALAQSTLDHFKRDGVKIGFANEAPFGFRQANGEIVGYDYELAKLVFSRMGINNVTGVLVNFGSLIPGLKANRFDIIAAGLYVRKDRCSQVLFSDPILAVGDTLLVPAGNPKKIHSFHDVGRDPAIKIGGTTGGLAKDAIDDGVPEQQIVQFPDWVSAIAALKSGRIDAALQTTVTARWTVKSSNDPTMEVATPFAQPVVNGQPKRNYAAFAFGLDHEALRTEFNAELKKTLGSPAHRKILETYGMSSEELPGDITLAQICAR